MLTENGEIDMNPELKMIVRESGNPGRPGPGSEALNAASHLDDSRLFVAWVDLVNIRPNTAGPRARRQHRRRDS
jgi:hypothetical protein